MKSLLIRSTMTPCSTASPAAALRRLRQHCVAVSRKRNIRIPRPVGIGGFVSPGVFLNTISKSHGGSIIKPKIALVAASVFILLSACDLPSLPSSDPAPPALPDGTLRGVVFVGTPGGGSDSIRSRVFGRSRSAWSAGIEGQENAIASLVNLAYSNVRGNVIQGSNFSDYKYVTVFFKGEDINDLDGYAAKGVIGLISDRSNIPTSGKARYSGEAFVLYGNSARGRNFSGPGDSIVEADFNNQEVNITIKDIESNIFDAILVGNLDMSGNIFSHDDALSMSFERKGASVTERELFAPDSQSAYTTYTSVAGAFFGPRNSRPQEVAGIIGVEGTGSYLRAEFIAKD